MKKASVIIQARMGASRLPDKVLMPLAGKPVLEHVIRRCQHAKLVDRVIVATTVDPKDLAVVTFVSGLGVGVFCGSVDDILDRYYQAAKLFELQHIVRITADCPMIDPGVIDDIILKHIKNGSDYTTNIIKPSYPDGEDVEIFKMGALEKAWKNAKLFSEREHVTPYIRNNPQIFKLLNVACKIDLSEKRWTLDEKKDYEFIKKIYKILYKENKFFGMEETLAFLESHPKYEKINNMIGRNEGYRKSLANDRKVF